MLLSNFSRRFLRPSTWCIILRIIYGASGNRKKERATNALCMNSRDSNVTQTDFTLLFLLLFFFSHSLHCLHDSSFSVLILNNKNSHFILLFQQRRQNNLVWKWKKNERFFFVWNFQKKKERARRVDKVTVVNSRATTTKDWFASLKFDLDVKYAEGPFQFFFSRI